MCQTRYKRVGVLGGLGLLAAVVALSAYVGLGSRDVRAQEQPTIAGPTEEEIARVEAISSVFRKVAQKVTPAVVRIRVEAGTAKSDKEDAEDSKDSKKRDIPDELRKFFRDHGLPDIPRQWRMPDFRQRLGMGSGVIIDARNGYVLTNNHVVDDADPKEVTVTTADQRRFKAEWIRTDEMSDVAVIKLKNPERLSELKLGDSDKVQVGDWVIAVGSPFGESLSKTVTFGIISAKGRDMLGLAIDYQNFLQTDAAINPGNSGGPLVNMRGEIIGLNTAIASGTAQYAGVGFALPSNMAKWVMTQLIEHSKVVRGYLGVQIQNLEDQPGLAKSFGLKSDKGVVITDVMGSPAKAAGLKAGDVITGIDGKEVATTTELSGRVAMLRPGTKAKFQVWREGKPKDIEVTVGQQPKDFRPRGGPLPRDGESGDEVAGKIDSLGITVVPLDETNGKKYDWKGTEGGLLVTEVDPGGVAGRDISVGDLILQVHDKPVKSVEEFRKLTGKEALAEGIRITVKSRRAGVHFLYLQSK